VGASDIELQYSMHGEEKGIYSMDFSNSGYIKLKSKKVGVFL